MKIKQCNRNPYFLADFAYDGEFSDGGHFELRIPEKDVEEFATKLLQAYKDDMDGKVKVVPPHVHITEKGNIFHDGSVVKETPEEILAMPDIEEGNKAIDWEQRRYEIAKDITAAICTSNARVTLLNYNQIVAAADGLIRELKKGTGQ